MLNQVGLDDVTRLTAHSSYAQLASQSSGSKYIPLSGLASASLSAGGRDVSGAGAAAFAAITSMSFWSAALLLTDREFLRATYSASTEMIQEVRVKCTKGGIPKILRDMQELSHARFLSKELQEIFDVNQNDVERWIGTPDGAVGKLHEILSWSYWQATNGLLQGDPLSVVILNCVLCPLLRQLSSISGLSVYAFANNLTIVSSSWDTLHQAYHFLGLFCSNTDLILNISKCQLWNKGSPLGTYPFTFDQFSFRFYPFLLGSPIDIGVSYADSLSSTMKLLSHVLVKLLNSPFLIVLPIGSLLPLFLLAVHLLHRSKPTKIKNAWRIVPRNTQETSPRSGVWRVRCWIVSCHKLVRWLDLRQRQTPGEVIRLYFFRFFQVNIVSWHIVLHFFYFHVDK